jgi:hypothetical protein
MAKTGESYATARRQVLAEPSGPPAPGPADERMAAALHVSNGDSTDLSRTGLVRRVVYWRDILHDGPVPAVPPHELRQIRASFLARTGATTHAQALDMFVERDRVLEANRDGEYVLWFEADLYDQLQIIEILARLADLDVPAPRISLICIGEHPGIAGFGGLGELTADQLRDLPATKACARLTPAALQLATRAWAAFRAPTPDALAGIVVARSPELRFLGEAFDRLCREYPSTRDGLSLTERRILAAVDEGAPDAGAAFSRVFARETRPFLGDLTCFATMDRMVHAPIPLLDAEPAGQKVDRHTRLGLTEPGGRVLAGKTDDVAQNGIDRWIGGVHLHGRRVPWRWDDGTEAITG